jgi:hypothetical protein
MEQELIDALNKVFTLSDRGNFPYAKSYAQAALNNPYTNKPMEGEELRVQLNCILSNLSHWSGYDAQVSKAIFKQYAGIKVRYT